jgi:hypothetical protein
MSEIDLDEVQEVKLHLTRRELQDIKQYVGIEMAMGNFIPEDDPIQKMAVRVLVEAGLVKLAEPQKGRQKSRRK